MATALIFDPSYYRGPYLVGHFAAVDKSHADVAMARRQTAYGLYLKNLKLSVGRIASAAGPLTADLAVKMFKATASIFKKMEIELIQMTSVRRSPAATASVAPGSAAPAPAAGAKGKGKGGGAGAAIKSIFTMAAKIMSAAAGPAGFSRRSDEDDNDENHFWARSSCVEPEKLKAQYTL